MPPIYGYWNIRGYGEPIRYLLYYKGVEFEDKRHLNRESWFDDEKYKQELDFPNLPYYIDGDLRLTQSTAILRHLAREHGLTASIEKDRAIEEMFEQQILDMRRNLNEAAYRSTVEEFEETTARVRKNLPLQVKQLSTFLGDKKYFIGDKISYVDFIAYDVLDFHELFEPSVFKDTPNLKAYMKRFESIPELQKYFKSGTYKTWPIYGPHGHFGGKGDKPKKA